MNPLIKIILSTNTGVDLATLRIVTGLILMSHDSQKLSDTFGSASLNDMVQWFESIGLIPGYPLATPVDSAKFFGNLALVIGLLMHPASAVMDFTIIMAIFSVHIDNGFFITDNGYEYALTLLMVSVAPLIDGAGRSSLDSKLSCRTGLATKKGGHLRIAILFRCGTQHKVSISPATSGLHS